MGVLSTIFGSGDVISKGMDLIDQLKLGDPSSGAIDGMPDRILKVSVIQ